MKKVSFRSTLLFHLVFFLSAVYLICFTNASSVALTSDNTESNSQQCSGNSEEDKILCDAARVKDESIRKVVEEDATSRVENDTPSSDRAQDVWTAAYNQWIEKESNEKTLSIDRAIREAQKSNPSAKTKETQNEQDEKLQDPINLEQDDDELTIITAAVRKLSDKMATSQTYLNSLATIEDLCYSGDNGRQVEATGGIENILDLLSHTDEQVHLLAVKSIATCAQNNPKVFNKAVQLNAISRLLQRIAVENNDEWRASILRAIVTLSDAKDASQAMFSEKDKLIPALLNSFDAKSTNGRRSRIRALALIEQCLRVDSQRWLPLIHDTEILERARGAIKSDDIDIREGAARVLKLIH